MKQHTEEYERFMAEVEKWPNWKKEAYNSLATSAHAVKLKIEPPITWNDAINAMSAEEKGAFFATFDCPLSLNLDWCDKHKNCKTCMTAFFNSPCDGVKREGAGE